MADTSPRLRHVVFFWLNNPESREDRDRLVAGLETLRGIEVIRSLHIGVPAATEERAAVDHSFDVAEFMEFDDSRDQKAYQDHPLHRRFVAECSQLWGKHLVYDAMDVA